MEPIVEGLIITPINTPVQNAWVLRTDFLFVAGRFRGIVVKCALVLWFLHQIPLQVVKETNGVDGCACSEVGKELELAEASHLLYAVLKYLLTCRHLLAATCIRYWLIFGRSFSLFCLGLF